MNTLKLHEKHISVATFIFPLILSLSLLALPTQEVYAQTTHEVKIAGFAFNPQNITITQGDSVMWNNTDPVIHTLWFVYVANGSTYLLSAPIPPSTIWTQTFNDPVELQYYSFDRLWITGFINVTESIPEVHDIAVTDITTCKDGCDPMRTVYSDTTMHVNVTVVNNGDLSESFIVTAKADGTVIGTQNVVNLPPTNSAVVLFLWNTSGYTIGNCTLSAVAGPVSGETNTGDNTLIDGIVKVTIIGDINGDDKVDMKDIGRAARAFGTNFGDLDYDPNADLNDDHKIDMKDIGTAARYFGSTYP